MTTEFRLYLLTWNVGETNPPKDLTKLLGLNGKNLPNLYAVGLQEMKSSTASRVSDLVFEDIWTTAITDCLSTRNYVRIKMRRLLGIHLSVYVRRVDLPYITNVESECTKTGFGGLWGNKGALSIRLDAFGVNVCIVNAHFTAHEENFRQRLEDYNSALETQRFRDKVTESILDHDYVFWMGDLNFRLEDVSNADVRKHAKERDFQSLKIYDQLNKALKEELIFLDFLEGPLNFPPTFKFDVGTDVYDTSTKNRIPSYCDRVLWRVHDDSYEGIVLSVDQLSYGSIMDEKSSDHKPVYAEFIIQVLKTPPELPVMFEPMNCWCQHKDNEVSYLISSGFPLNSRDWIGLYREGYKNWLDYVTYVWASSKGEDMHDESHMHSVVFESRYLQRLPSDTYYLLYFSFIKNCVVGYSDGFRLLMTEESSASSSEGEEDALHLSNNISDAVDGYSSNNSLIESGAPCDQREDNKGWREWKAEPSEEEEESGSDEEIHRLLEYVEPDRELMRQRQPVQRLSQSESEKSREELRVEKELFAERPERDEGNDLEPQPKVDEPQERQVLNEPEEQLLRESEESLLNDSREQLFKEPEESLLNDSREQLSREPEESLLNDSREQLLRELEQSLPNDSREQLSREPEQSLLNDSREQLSMEPEQSLLNDPEEQLPREPEQKLICVPDEHLLKELEQLVLTEHDLPEQKNPEQQSLPMEPVESVIKQDEEPKEPVESVIKQDEEPKELKELEACLSREPVRLMPHSDMDQENEEQALLREQDKPVLSESTAAEVMDAGSSELKKPQCQLQTVPEQLQEPWQPLSGELKQNLAPTIEVTDQTELVAQLMIETPDQQRLVGQFVIEEPDQAELVGQSVIDELEQAGLVGQSVIDELDLTVLAGSSALKELEQPVEGLDQEVHRGEGQLKEPTRAVIEELEQLLALKELEYQKHKPEEMPEFKEQWTMQSEQPFLSGLEPCKPHQKPDEQPMVHDGHDLSSFLALEKPLSKHKLLEPCRPEALNLSDSLEPDVPHGTSDIQQSASESHREEGSATPFKKSNDS